MSSEILNRLKQGGGASAVAKAAAASIGVKTENKAESAEEDPVVTKEAFIVKSPKPVVKDGETLFKTAKSALNTSMPNGVAINFKNGYYVTNKPDEIAFLKANAKSFQLVEEK